MSDKSKIGRLEAELVDAKAKNALLTKHSTEVINKLQAKNKRLKQENQKLKEAIRPLNEFKKQGDKK